MQKELFEQVIAKYQAVLEECEAFVKLFEDTTDLEELSIKDFKELITKAQKLQGKADGILHNELYHLIGMGNLTSVQTSKLCAVIKKIASTRSYFKPVAGYVLNKLPKVPDKSDYKCGIAGIQLKSVFKK